MKSKFTLLSLGVLALVAALPAAAPAGEPVLDAASGKWPLPFTISGGLSEWRFAGEPEFTCTSSTASGKFTSGTTGEMALTFHGCTTSFFGFPVSCNTSSHPSGTIKLNTSVFHNVYLTDAKTAPGLLITPPAGGVIMTIICGSFVSIEVKGNGILGRLEAP
jgi:hypothetical protein